MKIKKDFVLQIEAITARQTQSHDLGNLLGVFWIGTEGRNDNILIVEETTLG